MRESVHTPSNLSDGILSDFLQYWIDLCGNRPIPIWSDVKAEKIPRFVLPHLIVLEILEDNDFYYRLTGTKVDEYMGFTLQGYRLSKAPFRDDKTISQAFHAIVEAKEPQYSNFALGTKLTDFGKTERVVAPMSNSGTNVDMLIGAVVYSAPSNIYVRKSFTI